MTEYTTNMDKSWVRITSIEIRDLKNIEFGTISFTSRKETFNSSVLGLYGQNGSGKTALINAIDILRMLLKGESLPEQAVYLIRNDSPYAHLKFCFEIHSPDSVYMVEYSFVLKKENKENPKNN